MAERRRKERGEKAVKVCFNINISRLIWNIQTLADAWEISAPRKECLQVPSCERDEQISPTRGDEASSPSANALEWHFE